VKAKKQKNRKKNKRNEKEGREEWVLQKIYKKLIEIHYISSYNNIYNIL